MEFLQASRVVPTAASGRLQPIAGLRCALKYVRTMVIKHEPEVRRAKARGYVAWCNKSVHEAPWTKGNTTTGGEYVALELAELAYQAHALPYERALSKMDRYDPRRFTWVCDEGGEVDDCVKVRDDQTGRLAIWRHWVA